MICENDQRRELLRAYRQKHTRPDLFGLDYVEVKDDGLTLTAYIIGKLPDALKNDRPGLTKVVRVEGGRRVRDIRVLDVDLHVEKDPQSDDALVIVLDKPGDFSRYTLRLVDVEGVDPFYDSAEFSFKVDCPSELDCALPNTCPPAALNEPEINYLARDYSSFRQLILDRLALIMPEWKERHVPDLEITLVELLAYVGDHLSYYQDAVATEAYLDTARQRISVRRHARLVDYFLHEGCNARAWLALSLLSADTLPLDLKDVNFLAMIDPTRSVAREMLSPDEFLALPPDAYEVFEPVMHSQITLHQSRNEIHFYTWGQRECCLPRGATSASLLDAYAAVSSPGGYSQGGGSAPADKKAARGAKQAPTDNSLAAKPVSERLLALKVGDVLIFEEVIGPKTGNPADADPTRRAAVRLTKVTLNEDPLVLTEVQNGETTVRLPTPVVDIEWHSEDALTFALCLSAVTDAPECKYLENISVARGNVILVDHGRSLPPEDLGTVPLEESVAQCECGDRTAEVTYRPGPFRPSLKNPGLSYRQPLPTDNPGRHVWQSASRLTRQDPRAALPLVTLSEVPGASGGVEPLFTRDDLADPSDVIRRMRDPQDALGITLTGKLSLRTQKSLAQLKEGEEPPASLLADVHADLEALLRIWEARFDLLHSGPDDLQFVVEMDNAAVAHLRFGNNDLGEQPHAGSAFAASYRVGNGQRGNVGAEAIRHTVISLSGADVHARNPLPAVGGVDAEPMAEAKLYAPFTFRKRRERAIVAGDYAEIALREFSSALQGAAAHLDWSGSWFEAEVALDPFGAESAAPGLEQVIGRRLEVYRRMGHDLRVETATYVPLDIGLTVCIRPNYLRGHVEAALLELFSSRVLPNGKKGFFHPDRLAFGEDIELSQLVAAAQAVEGVSSVAVTRLGRLFEGANQELETGVLPLGPFEIAQLDNDPDFPERGRFTLVVTGGR